MKVVLKADSELIKNPLIQWEILRQLLDQRTKSTKQISVGPILGTVELSLNEKTSGVIDFIKSKAKNPFSGELNVIGEASREMSKLHFSRFERVQKDLNSLLTTEIKKAYSYPKEWFKPPLTVAKQAEKGLKLRAKYKRGGLSTQEAGKLGIGSGVQRAVDLKQREHIKPDTIKRMLSFFARHEKHKDNKNEKGEPTAGPISWLLWGGDEGREWAKRVKAKMDKYEKENN